MSGKSSDPIEITDSDSSSDFDQEIADLILRIARPLRSVMAARSRDRDGAERAHLIVGAPDELKWIHPDIKVLVASDYWRDPDVIRELENNFITADRIQGITFRPAEDDERICSYHTRSFVMFYGDVVSKLHICPPFSQFQKDVLCAVNVCPSQLTWNAWAFILCFEIICVRLRINPTVESFFYFFTFAQQKKGGWVHFLQRPERVVIVNTISSIRTWKQSFFKVCSARGYDPFFLGEDDQPLYPIQWSEPVKPDRGRSVDDLSPGDLDAIALVISAGPHNARQLISSWLNHEPIDIPRWKMDSQRFAEARARVRAQQRPLIPPTAQIGGPNEPQDPEPSAEMTSGGSSGRGRARKPSPRAKATVSRKRKAPSGSASGAPSGSSSGEKDRGAVAESSCGRKLKSLCWSEMGLIDPPEDAPLTFENVDSLWYRNCDYGSFLRQQLLPSLDVERNEEFVKEKGAVRLVKSSAMQIARSLGSILYSVPALAQLAREHAAADPAEVERLKQAVDEKNSELSKMAAGFEEEKNHLQERLKRVNEVLLQRDHELEVERKALAAVRETASAQEAKLREELQKADDAGYILFQQGFDAALAQVKHFNPKERVDLSKVDRDRDLADIILELEETAGDNNVDN